MSMDFSPGPFLLTVVRTGKRQKTETFEVTTVGLGLGGALHFVADGKSCIIPSGGWKSFEVSRPGFRFKHVPGQAAAVQKPGGQAKN